MRPLTYWNQALRPSSVPAFASPALIGYSYVFYLLKTGAVSDANWINGGIAVVGVIIFHLAGSLITGYYDYKKGLLQPYKTDDAKVLKEKSPQNMLVYGYLLLLLAIAVTAYLYLQTGLVLLIFGAIAIIGVLLYHKLKNIPRGDVFVFLIYGMMMALGVVYVMTIKLIWAALFIAVPTGLLLVATLLARNTSDMLMHKSAGISTPAIRLDLEGSQLMYQTILFAAYLIMPFLVLFGVLHVAAFLVLLSFMMAMKSISMIKHATMESLDEIQNLSSRTAYLVMLFSLLLIVGNIIAAYI